MFAQKPSLPQDVRWGYRMEDVLVFDPGQATGWSYWMLPDDEPIERVGYGVIPGGLYGFVRWCQEHHALLRNATVVCESFKAESTAVDMEPLLIEGALCTVLEYLACPPPVWQPRHRKRAIGDKRTRDGLLKSSGLWLSADQVEWVDGRDANDTALHALIYAKDSAHEPSLRHYWPPEDL